jgi:hypothetical protein
MPPNTVYVGRVGHGHNPYENPFKIGRDGTREEVIAKFEVYLDKKLKENPHFLDPLKGKDLACWCPLNLACHADIILKKVEFS